jgi:class 3 adenylate cyclase/predicted ATPase
VDIAAWLRDLGLEQYAQAFRENDVDARVLTDLTADDLRDIGVTSVGHRRLILAAIARLAPEGAGRAEPGPSSATTGVPTDRRHREAERRHLTVMFVDLVGSTALSARLDPEEFGAVLHEYQNSVSGEIARFAGHVAKFMGDGVLCYFGWPTAHEDAAERAVRAGLAIVEAVAGLATSAAKPLAARVGIATGLVVVGDLVGEGAAQEAAVVGETPNLAARLQQLAAPGAVVVTEATRRLLGTLFEFTDLGPAEVKGFAAPVRGLRVSGEGPAEGRFEALHGAGAAPLVGRDQELALLLERWRLAKAGEGQVVLLSGEPGIGKSRIVLALRERLRSEERVSLRYHGSPYHANSALHPVVEQLARAAGFARDDDDATRLAKLEALLALAVADVAEVVPFFAELLSLPTDGRFSLPPLTPQEKNARTFRALLAQLEGLATRSPVLMVLEDAHWVDPTTLELFDLAVQRLERLPVLLVVTYRPQFRPPWARHAHATALALNRLGRTAAEAIVDRLAAGRRPPAPLLQEIVAKADGVPLFVEELTKAVLESGLLRETADGYALDGPLLPLAIPATLQDSLIARLDRLASVKEVAQVGAVIGREFSREVLAAVADLGDDRLSDAMAQLVDAGLVFARGVPPDVTYTFKHALVQDAAYQSLLKSRRHQLHARAAEILETCLPGIAETEPERVAHHFTEAGLADRAAGWWLRAGQRAWRRAAFREAAAHLRRGIEVIASLPSTPERARLEAKLENMLAVAHLVARGPSEEAEMALTRARALATEAGDAEEEFAAAFGQWYLNQQRMNLPAVLRLAQELLAGLGPDTPEALVLQAHHAAWMGHLMCGRHEEACRHAEVGFGLYRREAHHAMAERFAGHDAGACCRYTLGFSSQLLGHAERARDRMADALALAASLAHPQTQIVTLTIAATMYALRRDAPMVRKLALLAVEECGQQGVPTFGAGAELMLAWADAMLDPEPGARDRITRALAVLEERRFLVRRPFYLGVQAEVCLQANAFADGLASTEAALACIEAGGERWYEPELHRLRGELLLRASRDGSDEAGVAFQRAIDVACVANTRWFELRAATSLARLRAERGERDQAHDLLAPVLGRFTEGFDTVHLQEAKALLDGLA